MEAVLFDLFETLVSHFDPQWKPPLRSTAERLGVDSRFYERNWSRFEKQWEAGAIERYEDALAELCAAAGVPPNERMFSELKREYIDYAARTAFVEPDPEVVRMLETLRDAGLKLAVVTNANDLDSAPWAAHGLARYFDIFIASHQARLLKPDARIYRLACESLQVEPSDAVFVGDGGSNELWGAKEAGIEPLWCTWFLDRWPEGIRPNGFPDDDWRQRAVSSEAPYPRFPRPRDLLEALLVRRAV